MHMIILIDSISNQKKNVKKSRPCPSMEDNTSQQRTPVAAELGRRGHGGGSSGCRVGPVAGCTESGPVPGEGRRPRPSLCDVNMASLSHRSKQQN